ncbi:MAG: small multidrug resistance family (SMR) protein [uncultured Blastococcus sp.]|uniref:Small multidrug resistance family (SMR) protein n=1 Tax=uncultured Blastococcus sp. TaxID=217144 RepID=A0A6J4JAS3_9ACTN|nr:MAG: small multidrug resistance family (SMR) protein [uncultured Blastococcus sp.]
MTAAASPPAATPPAPAQSRAKAWVMLLLAAVFEIIFALATGKTDGFTVLWPSVISIVGVALSIYFLTQALKTLDVGVGYTIWTGIGSVGTVVLGAVIFGESLGLAKIGAFVLIIGGVIGLQQSDRKPRLDPTDPDCEDVPIGVRCGGTAAMPATTQPAATR